MRKREKLCPFCGGRVLWVPEGKTGRFKVDAELVGYRRLNGNERMGDVFFTDSGGIIKGFREEENPDGYAHRPHYLRCKRSGLTGP